MRGDLGGLFVGALLLAGAAYAGESRTSDLRELITQLGHPVYEERLDARRRLGAEGLTAFDLLREARSSPDPEIADACERLLAEVTEAIARPDDPPPVRRWLTAYLVSEGGNRLEVVGGLASLPGEQAVPALVRLARFDPTDRGAREAARAVLAISGDRRFAYRPDAVVEAVNRLTAVYGPGQRPAAQWLSLAAEEAADPGKAGHAEQWSVFAEAARAGYPRPERANSLEVVAALHWRWLNAALAAGDKAGALAAADSLVGLDSEDAIVRLARAARWAANARAEEVIDAIVETHAELLTNKRGRYLLADLAERRGDISEAARLAEHALSSGVDTSNATVQEVLLGPRVVVARELYEIGRIEWCIAEYRAAAEWADPLEGRAAYAAWKLANLLFDAERYQEASEALAPLTEAIGKSRSARGEFMQLPQVQRGLLPQPGTLIARQRFSRALAARDAGDYETEMKELRNAINSDPSDADVLIAMYRVPNPPAAFTADTERRIAAKRRDYESDIWDSPTDADPFNQWAWLVSNTEGDFEKAVRYSRRSLDIAPETAGFLDTLGRCLLSAGRLDEALAAQRRAVELDPRMLVLQRQLAEIEAAVAARDKGGSP